MSRGGLRQAFGDARITKGALYLLFAMGGTSLIFLLGGDELRVEMFRWLGATSASIWSDFKIWQLVTSPLLEIELIGLLFHAFMLWMFLPALERWWGTKRFLLFALYTSVAGVAVGTLVGSFLPEPALSAHGVAFIGHPVTGLGPFIFAGIVAYGILFANHQVRFFGVLPMTGRQLTIGICAFVGLFIILGQQWAKGSAWAAAMVLGWAMTSDRVSFKLWTLRRKQRKLRRRHLRLVEDDDDEKKKPKRWMN
jgi:membrane associated rhomboid family serine protease